MRLLCYQSSHVAICLNHDLQDYRIGRIGWLATIVSHSTNYKICWNRISAHAPVWSPSFPLAPPSGLRPTGIIRNAVYFITAPIVLNVQPLQGWLLESFQLCCRPWVSPTTIQIKPLQGLPYSLLKTGISAYAPVWSSTNGNSIV